MKLLFLLLISSQVLVAKPISTSLCSHKYNDQTISMVHKEKGCEFPEGNKVSCIIPRIEFLNKDNKKDSRDGFVVLRENADFNAFCLSNKVIKIDGQNYRDITPSEGKEMDLFMKCPSSKDKLSLLIRSKSRKKLKECSIGFISK